MGVGVGVCVGDGVGVGVMYPNASISASPTFRVDALTELMRKRMLVTERGANVTVVAAPALSRAGTATMLPFEKVRLPPMTRSPELGRS